MNKNIGLHPSTPGSYSARRTVVTLAAAGVLLTGCANMQTSLQKLSDLAGKMGQTGTTQQTKSGTASSARGNSAPKDKQPKNQPADDVWTRPRISPNETEFSILF